MPPRIIDGIGELESLVGLEAGVSDWFAVTQDRIDAFADVTLDRLWIHCDPERARSESPYGTTIAHGFLTLSLLSHLLHQAIQFRGNFIRGVNYGFNRVRFPAPVPVGSRIRAHCRVLAATAIPDGIQVTWEITVEAEGQAKPVLVAEWLTRSYVASR